MFPGLELGDARLRVYEAPPCAELQSYIHAAWFMEWDIPTGTGLAAIAVPTPCVKIGAIRQSGGELRYEIHGIRAQGGFYRFSGCGQSFGIDFQPGAFHALSGLSLMGWQNKRYRVADVFTRFPIAPAESYWTVELAARWFRDVLSLFSKKVEERQLHFQSISLVVERLWKGDVIRIPELARILETSKRSVLRVFQNEVGLSVRDLMRIVRFQKALKAVSRSNVKGLAEAAADSGFFDQPHMTREFRALVRLPPSNFKKFF
ncbi:MAG: helix-turn-helix domain-containing protein [Bdellovibrionales bacterium]